MPSKSSNFRPFIDLLNAYSFSDHPQPNNFVGLLGTFSSSGHSTPAFSWTCSALSLLPVIQHQHFCGLARHFLFFWSFSTANFMDLLNTYFHLSHLQFSNRHFFQENTPHRRGPVGWKIKSVCICKNNSLRWGFYLQTTGTSTAWPSIKAFTNQLPALWLRGPVGCARGERPSQLWAPSPRRFSIVKSDDWRV